VIFDTIKMARSMNLFERYNSTVDLSQYRRDDLQAVAHGFGMACAKPKNASEAQIIQIRNDMLAGKLTSGQICLYLLKTRADAACAATPVDVTPIIQSFPSSIISTNSLIGTPVVGTPTIVTLKNGVVKRVADNESLSAVLNPINKALQAETATDLACCGSIVNGQITTVSKGKVTGHLALWDSTPSDLVLKDCLEAIPALNNFGPKETIKGVQFASEIYRRASNEPNLVAANNFLIDCDPPGMTNSFYFLDNGKIPAYVTRTMAYNEYQVKVRSLRGVFTPLTHMSVTKVPMSDQTVFGILNAHSLAVGGATTSSYSMSNNFVDNVPVSPAIREALDLIPIITSTMNRAYNSVWCYTANTNLVKVLRSSYLASLVPEVRVKAELIVWRCFGVGLTLSSQALVIEKGGVLPCNRYVGISGSIDYDIFGSSDSAALKYSLSASSIDRYTTDVGVLLDEAAKDGRFKGQKMSKVFFAHFSVALDLQARGIATILHGSSLHTGNVPCFTSMIKPDFVPPPRQFLDRKELVITMLNMARVRALWRFIRIPWNAGLDLIYATTQYKPPTFSPIIYAPPAPENDDNCAYEFMGNFYWKGDETNWDEVEASMVNFQPVNAGFQPGPNQPQANVVPANVVPAINAPLRIPHVQETVPALIVRLMAMDDLRFQAAYLNAVENGRFDDYEAPDYGPLVARIDLLQ